MELNEIKDAIDGQGRAFEEFKKTNDENLKKRDALLEEKLKKIGADLDKFEDVNQKLTLAQQQQKGLQEQLDRIETRLKRPGAGGEAGEKSEAKAAFESFCRKGRAALAPDEVKVLVSADDTAGGVLAPVEYVREIIKAVVLVSPMRSIVRVRPTGQRSIQVPKRTGTFSASWVSEIQARTEASGLAYGMVEIPTQEMTAEVYISAQELEDSVFDLQAEMTMEFSEQFGVTEGAAVVNGNGVGKPFGITDAGSGVASTVSGTAANIADASGQANGIIDLFHAVKTAYAQRGVWTLNRKTLGAVRKLQDSQKRYIWEPGIANGIPNTILGAPYVEVPDMPDEGANAYPMAFGDFRRAYTMVDRIAMSVVRDDYTKASVGQVRFVARRRVGGQVVLAEAIRLLKCST